jgi:hypothetical protein
MKNIKGYEEVTKIVLQLSNFKKVNPAGIL